VNHPILALLTILKRRNFKVPSPTLIGEFRKWFKDETNRHIARFVSLSIQLFFAMLFLVASEPYKASAGEFSDSDEMFQRLVKPMKSIVDGKPFREALQSIAAQAELNLWLDRRVDPTKPVSLGPIGPTPFAAVKQLAESRGCVAMPIANVLLVGRETWVDQTAATIMDLQLDAAPSKADIQWDDLATPVEALTAAVGSEVSVTPALPHDLWPAVNWQGVDRRVAVAVILAQFGRRPDSTESIRSLTTVRANDRGSFAGRYALGDLNATFRNSFLQSDRRGTVEREGRFVNATGRIAAHRNAIGSAIGSIRPRPSDVDESTFTIKRMRTSARNAFDQLAKMAGRSCRINDDAAQACQKIVSIEGADLTLRQLTDRVATEAGVVATWSVDTIVISGQTGRDR
jgi:hypothetical protein